MPENFANRYQTTLTAGVTSGALTGTVTSATGVPAVPFRAIISAEGANTAEIVLVTGRSGTTLTWTRAAEAVAGVQVASAHAIGATFTAIVTAVGFLAATSILPPSNGVDDTAVIQAALDDVRLSFEAGTVRGLPGQTYLITTIRIGSFTTLDMTGCTVVQIDGTDTNMLQNVARQSAITIQDAAITAGDATLTSATAAFDAGDVGVNVRIWAAGLGGEPFVNTIQSVTNATTVELYSGPYRTVTAGQATIGQWDMDITVIGGLWDRADNGRLFLYEPGHQGDEDYRIQDSSGFAMLFRRCSRVLVRDLKFTNGNANTCTAVCFGDATDFVAENIAASETYISGLVQATGPARHGRFSGIYGRLTDDLCALLAVDWTTGVRDMWGDIAYITFEDIHSEECQGSLILICPGSASLGISTEHIFIRNVYGTDTNLTQQQGGLIWIADSTSYADMAGGFIDDVVIENVAGEPLGDYNKSRGLVYIETPNAGRIRLSGLNVHTPTGGSPGPRHGVVIGPNNTNIGYLTITDSVISSIDGGCDLVNYDVATGATIQNLGLARNAYRVNGVWTLITEAGPPTYSETVLATADLLLYWRLGEAAGTNANDETANNLDGTYVNGTLGATGLLAGDVDTAWTGNGTNSSITGPTIPAQATWTILLWAKSNGVNADYAGYFSTPGDRIDIVRVVAGSTGQLYFYDGTGWTGGLSFAVDVTATMIAVTYDGTDLRTYINGGNLVYYAGRGRSLLNAAFTVGDIGGTETIDTLDEFAIFSRALTAVEIAALYALGS